MLYLPSPLVLSTSDFAGSAVFKDGIPRTRQVGVCMKAVLVVLFHRIYVLYAMTLLSMTLNFTPQ